MYNDIRVAEVGQIADSAFDVRRRTMEQQWKCLAQGVELVCVRTDRFKTGLFSVTLAVPLRRETAAAGALIPEVLYRGCSKYPDIESISAAVDGLYGASFGPFVRQRGESQCIGFLCSFIDDCYTLNGSALLEPAAELLSELLLKPLTVQGLFRRDYVKSEGANLSDCIRARVNDKWNWSIFRLLQEMCVGEAYALDKLGTAEEALVMTPEMLWTAYQTLLAQARIIFYYGGSADPGRVEDAVRRFFKPLLTGRTADIRCQVVSKPKGPVRTVEEVMDVAQAKLAIGFRTGGIVVGHSDYPALLVCNALYGGSATSKLFANVREKLSLCYDISSVIDKLKGLMVVTAGVETTDLDRAQDVVLGQLEAVRRGDFTLEELNAAVRAVSNGLRSRRDSQGCLEDDCVTELLSTGRMDDGMALIRAVEQVTADDVVRSAQMLGLDTVYRLTGKGDAARG